ncbi:MAG: RNA methyltransferase [Gammaproteobacteria bacterium]|nr:RNA methyltransferase [Gammaproteobacteria bacterium]
MDTPEIRIVLVEPSHPGNIGAVARAMKNMGLEQLVLVNPRQFPHSEAIARASGADDVLEKARVVATVTEALAGCGFIAATTSRTRDQYFRVADVREAAQRVLREALRGPAAVLFGSERAGLTNEQLEAAHLLIRIPASEAYPSLNLAMAVQIVAYELHRARGRAGAFQRGHSTCPRSGEGPQTDVPAGGSDAMDGQWHDPDQGPRVPLAAPEEMERLYEHLAQVLEEVDFRDRTQGGTHLMARLRRLFQRAALDRNEVNILRGILTAVQSRRRRAGAGPERP